MAECPTLGNILASEECFENLAGLGSVVYVGNKADLNGTLAISEDTDEDNVYKLEYGTGTGDQRTGGSFKAGKGLYRFDCKEESQKYAFSSLERRKGYEITGTLILEAVNQKTAKVLRAMNNLDLFIIFQDNDGKYLIVYDPIRKTKADSGGIAGDTGDAADSDRQITLEYKLKPVVYPMYYVELTEGKTLDDYLASNAA
jgi:hypothetical protein